jgi:hypothetical protein
MIDPAQIPIEVRDALLKPITYPAGTSEENKMVIRFAAGLAAWPGMHIDEHGDMFPEVHPADLILPLTGVRDE